MNGMSVQGGGCAGVEHLYQSIRDILTTPIGTRIMRREYGSRLFDLLDRPMTPALLIDVYAAVAEALDRWEPRFRLKRVQAEKAAQDGTLVLAFEGTYLPDGREITLEGVVV